MGLCVFILLMGALGSYMIADDPDYFIGFELPVEKDEGIEYIEGTGTYCTDDYVSLTAFVKDGYVFKGWYDENGVLLESSETYEFLAYNSPIYATSERGVSLNLLRMDGVLATVSKTVKTGDTVTIEAIECGSEFLGWYTPDNKLFTDEKEYTFVATKDLDLIAMTDSELFDGDEKLTWTLSKDFSGDVEVYITDRYSRYFIDYVTNATSGTLYLIPGEYKVSAKGTLNDGNPATETLTYSIDGDIHRKYCWMLDGEPQYLEWTIDGQDYANCKNSTADRFPDEEDRLDFVDYTSDSMKALAATMLQKTSGMSKLDRANYVLKFVQILTDYESDYNLSSEGEYWKYPLETLFQRGGDCEDTSILYCSLMQAMGYKTALLIYDGSDYEDEGGHMAAGVSLDYVKGGTYYEMDGLDYYYCETTSDTMVVGEDWDIYDTATVLVLDSSENDIN